MAPIAADSSPSREFCSNLGGVPNQRIQVCQGPSEGVEFPSPPVYFWGRQESCGADIPAGVLVPPSPLQIEVKFPSPPPDVFPVFLPRVVFPFLLDMHLPFSGGKSCLMAPKRSPFDVTSLVSFFSTNLSARLSLIESIHRYWRPDNCAASC